MFHLHAQHPDRLHLHFEHERAMGLCYIAWTEPMDVDEVLAPPA
jgi:hypothetical protein